MRIRAANDTPAAAGARSSGAPHGASSPVPRHCVVSIEPEDSVEVRPDVCATTWRGSDLLVLVR